MAIKINDNKITIKRDGPTLGPQIFVAGENKG